MPWIVRKDEDACSADKPWGVFKQDTDELVACHLSEDMAKKQQAALYANERSEEFDVIDEAPPRDYAVRAVMPGPELVDRAVEGALVDSPPQPVMRGSLAVFDEWTAIDSRVEGQFMERLGRGSFRKTIAENRSRIRPIYDHGQDPQFGRHPLGPIDLLEERERSVDYEVPLLNTMPIREILIPGLRAGVYGASFRFRPTKVERVRPKHETEWNPYKWEERTVRELEMAEFGPTPFPVYANATAGLRSMTDEFRANQLGLDPELVRDLLTHSRAPEPHVTQEPGAAAPFPSISREEFIRRLRS